jgi:hypothetical protein
MSALPARITELPPEVVAVRSPEAGVRRRAERRAELVTARQTQRRWAAFSLAVLGCSFGLTVGILDVLH